MNAVNSLRSHNIAKFHSKISLRYFIQNPLKEYYRVPISTFVYFLEFFKLLLDFKGKEAGITFTSSPNESSFNDLDYYSVVFNKRKKK